MNTNHLFGIHKTSGSNRRFADFTYGGASEQPTVGGLQAHAGREFRGNEPDDESSGGGFASATQAANPAGPTGSDSETVTPVTIKQIRDAIVRENEPLKINKTVTKHVTVVGRVVRLNAQVTRISLLLDDCTGTIDAVYLLAPDEHVAPNEYALQKRTRIKEGLWVRIIGVLCLMEAATKIAVIRMRPVDDGNEVIFHRLDAVKTFLV